MSVRYSNIGEELIDQWNNQVLLLYVWQYLQRTLRMHTFVTYVLIVK